MKLRKALPALLLALLIGGGTVSAEEAAVSFSASGTGPADTVYVAGNPAAYPIEYYDGDSGTYQGLMPLLLEKIGAQTGYRFCYVYTGPIDSRYLLAKNKQVEVISGISCQDTLPEGVKVGGELLRFRREGEDCTAFFAFTALAEPALQAAFAEVLAGLSEKELTTLMFSAVAKPMPQRVSPYAVIGASVLTIGLLVAVFVLLVKYRHVRKQYYLSRFVDRLTGIGNQAFFAYRFRRSIPEKMKEMYCCYYFGFDEVAIKTTFGGNEYIELMKYAADILCRHCREKAVVAVVADGGFAVLQPALGPQDAAAYAQSALTALNGYEYMAGVGVKALFHAGLYSLSRRDKNPADVVYNAFQGYRKAVKEKRPLAFADEKMLLLDAEKEQYKTEIAAGMSHEDFKLYLQLIVDAKSGRFVAAEVLSRWENPDKGMLKPGMYLDVIHQIGLIEEFDLYTVGQTFKLLEQLKIDGLGHLLLSCNVTRASISDEGFADSVEKLLAGYTFRRQNLSIEITEESLIENPVAAKKNVEKLKRLGFLLAIDDMGTGYTSFSSMCSFPVDIVKIDREIVFGATTEKGRRLLGGIVALSHSLGFQTVCEGVENEETDRAVKEAGCDFIQGYYYSNTYPVKEAKRILSNG